MGLASVLITSSTPTLRDAGFIVAQDFSTLSGMDYPQKSLTWQGHEFLDAARNDRVWLKVMAHLQDRGLDAPISVIQQLATKFGASMLGLGE